MKIALTCMNDHRVIELNQPVAGNSPRANLTGAYIADEVH